MGNMGDHDYSLRESIPDIHEKNEFLINSRNLGDETDQKNSPQQPPRTPTVPPPKPKKPRPRKKDIYSTASIFQRSRRKKRPNPQKTSRKPLKKPPPLPQEPSDPSSIKGPLPPPPPTPTEEPPPILTPFLRPYSKKSSLLRQRLKNGPKKTQSPMCPMCREIFTLVDYHLLTQRSTSPSPSSPLCPFACSSSFTTAEAVKLHVTSVHLFCSCSGRDMDPHHREKGGDSMIVDPSPLDSLLICQCNDDRHKNSEDHLLSEEFPPINEMNCSKIPNYLMDLSPSILSPSSALSRCNKPSRSSTVNCMICAIKMKTVKDYLDHMKKYHGKISPINGILGKRGSQIKREEVKMEVKGEGGGEVNNEDGEPDSFGVWSLDPPFEAKRSRRGEDFPTEIEECKKEGESDNSGKNEDFEGFEGLEENSGGEWSKCTLNWSKETAVCSSGASKGLRRSYPRIIEESQDFDPMIKEYLLKLRRDHKSLSRALASMKSGDLRKSSESLEAPEIFDFDEETFQVKRECPRCGKQFHSMKELTEHFHLLQDPKEDENGEKIPWRCANCDKFFPTLQVLICHRYFIHDDESMVHICNNCCKILTSVAMVNSHECTSERFACGECSENFKGSKELLDHNKQRHLEAVGPHDCEICKKKFLTESMMKRHWGKCRWKEEEGVGGGRLHQCGVCGIFWKTSKELLQHVKKCHSFELCRLCNVYYPIGRFLDHVITSDLKNRAITKIINDNVDVFVDFIKTIGQEHLMSLVRYVSCDRIEDKVVCQICSETFSTELQYRIHNVRFHDFICVLCNWRFEDAKNAFEHKKKCHGSIYQYIWFAEEVMRVLADSEAFARLKQGFLKDEEILDTLEKRLTGNNNGNVEVFGEKNEEKDFFLIITTDDMEKYKNDVSMFAKKISESCDFIPIKDIEIMLRQLMYNGKN